MLKKAICLASVLAILLSASFTAVPAQKAKADETKTVCVSFPENIAGAYCEYRVGKGEWNRAGASDEGVSVKAGSTVSFRIIKPDEYSIGKLSLTIGEKTIPTSEAAEGLLSSDGYSFTVEADVSVYDLNIELVRMPSEVKLRFKKVAGTEGSDLQIATDHGNVDLAVEYCAYGTPYVNYNAMFVHEGYVYRDQVYESAVPRMVRKKGKKGLDTYTLTVKSYELYNNYRFRLGSNMEIGSVYVSNSDGTSKRELHFDNYAYADMRMALGDYSEIWYYYFSDESFGYEDPDYRDPYRYDGEFKYGKDGIVDVSVEKKPDSLSYGRLVINYAKADGYRNYEDVWDCNYAYYDIGGKRIRIYPTYNISGPYFGNPIRNWRSYINNSDITGNTFVLKGGFDPETMSVWAVGSGLAKKLKVSKTPYEVNHEESDYYPDFDYDSVLDGYEGYISLGDNGIEIWPRDDIYLCVVPAETELTPLPIPKPQHEEYKETYGSGAVYVSKSDHYYDGSYKTVTKTTAPNGNYTQTTLNCDIKGNTEYTTKEKIGKEKSTLKYAISADRIFTLRGYTTPAKTVAVDSYLPLIISKGALKGCTKATKITLGSTVTTIGADVFKGCKKLKTIEINADNLKTIKKGAFNGIPEKTVIKITATQKVFDKIKGKIEKSGISKKIKIKRVAPAKSGQ